MRRPLLAVLSGILLAAAFPGSGGRQELAFVALVPLLFAIEGAGWRRAGRLGFLSGLAFWLVTIPWIAGTIARHGGVPWVLAGAVLLALAAYLAMFTAAFCALVARSPAREGTLYVVVAASLWVALEFLRTYLLTGFPWNLLGYSQSRNLPLIQIAAVAGVYGVSFVLVSVNAALVRLVVASGRAWREGVDAVVTAGTVVVASLALAWLSPPAHDEPTARVALVQGNVTQDIKWDPAVQQATLDLYAGLTRQAARDGAGLILWPETAVPFIVRDDPRWSQVAALARDSGAHLLVGAPDVRDGLMRNSAFLLGPEGTLLGRYDKRHLVPFGEYVPLGRLLPFADVIAGDGIGAFAPGTDATVLETPAGRLGVVICYEAIFPGEVREFFRGGAEILVNLTNDAWFGRSAAPEQHLAMAVFRAVENRAYLIRAANTGISAIVAPDGHVVKASGLFTREVLTGAVAGRAGPSVYTRYGDLFAWTTAAVAFSVLWPLRSAEPRRWRGPTSSRWTLRRGNRSRVPTRWILVALAVGVAAAAAGSVWIPQAANGPGYQEVARWEHPGGHGRFVVTGPGPTAEELRALGDRLREESRGAATTVVMIFDDARAASDVREGARMLGEARFLAALRHQRAMYVKQPGREHQLVIYGDYPTIEQVVRY